MNFTYITNELVKRKRRSIFVVAGIGLGVGVFIAVTAVAAAFMTAARMPLQNLGSDILIQRSGDTPDGFKGALMPCGQVSITAQEIETVQKIDGIQALARALFLWVFDGADYTDGSDFKIVTGIEPDKNLGPGKVNEWLSAGAAIGPEMTRVALVDREYAVQKKIAVGDTVFITGVPFQVIGIVTVPPGAQMASSNLFIPLPDAQEIARHSESMPKYTAGDVNQLFLRVKPGLLGAVLKNITSTMPKVQTSSAESFVKSIGGIAAQSQKLAVICSVLVLLFSLLVVAKTIAGAILERRKEIGIMKTVGWTSRDIRLQILSETIVQSLAGGLLGTGLGFITARALTRLQISIPYAWEINPFPHFLASDAAQKALTLGLPVHLSPWVSLSAVCIAVGMGAASACIVLKTLNQIKPAEVLRNE